MKLERHLANIKGLAVLDRSAPMGAMGAMFNEVSSALYLNKNRPLITNFIYGLGGRDFTVDDAKKILREQKSHIKAGYITTNKSQV